MHIRIRYGHLDATNSLDSRRGPGHSLERPLLCVSAGRCSMGIRFNYHASACATVNTSAFPLSLSLSLSLSLPRLLSLSMYAFVRLLYTTIGSCIHVCPLNVYSHPLNLQGELEENRNVVCSFLDVFKEYQKKINELLID